MNIICITGKTGSGKSTFAKAFAEKLKYVHVDADKVCHEALMQKTIYNKIINKFGRENIVNETLEIDRKKLGNIVFEDEDKLNFIAHLSWEYLEKYIDKKLANKENIIIDGALVQKTKYFGLAKTNILVTAQEEKRKEYTMKRDKISGQYYEKRNKNSLNYEPSYFNYVYENNFESLNDDIDKIIQTLNLKPKIGFYAGSFDPFTVGHMQVIKEATQLFDKVIVGIGVAGHKTKVFNSNKMRNAIEKVLQELNITNVKVIKYTGLTTDVAEKEGATFLIRGLRNGTDYAYEENMAGINQDISNIPTIYLRATTYGNVSSSLVKELLNNGKDVSKYVPSPILEIIIDN